MGVEVIVDGVGGEGGRPSWQRRLLAGPGRCWKRADEVKSERGGGILEVGRERGKVGLCERADWMVLWIKGRLMLMGEWERKVVEKARVGCLRLEILTKWGRKVREVAESVLKVRDQSLK